MIEQPSLSGYQPLVGENPDLGPECWVIFYQRDLLLPEQGVVWSSQPDFLSSTDGAIVTGYWEGKALGVIHLDHLKNGLEPVSVRSILMTSTLDVFSLLSHAIQITYSRQSHQFCGRCGSQNRPVKSEWAMHCDQCQHSTYPRISPCIIVLVAKKRELLLVQHKRHRHSDMHTVIAGFIEPGESAEEAVHREVMEEAGLRLSSVSYQFSQSWPFPHSLMLGFHAEYESGTVKLEEKELAAGGWFSQDELPELPPPFTISRQLIDRFLRNTG